jgi:hypothetical protein
MTIANFFIDKARYFNRTLTLAVLLIAVSTFNYGFDNQAFATTQSMEPFTERFGVYDAKTKTWSLEPTWLSLFNSLNYIGFAAGKLLSCQTDGSHLQPSQGYSVAVWFLLVGDVDGACSP